MNNKQQALCVLLGGVGLGVVSLASPSVRDFADGFLGIPPKSSSAAVELRADLAAPSLKEPLRPEDSKELFQGFIAFSKAQYANAVPIIGKYALLGDHSAQQMMGIMRVFGRGLPLDREEGLRWLALAAAQGNRGAAELAATVNSTPDWEQRVAALAASVNASSRGERAGSEFAYAESPAPAPRYDFDTAIGDSSYSSPRPLFYSGTQFVIASPGSPPMGARTSIDQAYGDEAASRRYASSAVPSPTLGFGSPVILNRAGPGTYSDGNGDIYAQAGPHGVVNTRTGEFNPTN